MCMNDPPNPIPFLALHVVSSGVLFGARTYQETIREVLDTLALRN
jgi:hypothetical protein